MEPRPQGLDTAALLVAHDEDLRTEAELSGASHRHRIGPLWLGRYGAQGFVSYRDLDGLTGAGLDTLIGAAIAHFAADAEVTGFEWKTRGHDAPSDLGEHLARAGLVEQDQETVMIGETTLLADPEALPPGTRLRRAGDTGSLADDVASVGRLHRAVFGEDSPNVDEHLLRVLRAEPRVDELWLAELDGVVVGAGRLTRVPGTRFAGLFGGATAEPYRHRGIYRALTAARARAASALGARLVYAECTPFSRPILERSGLVAVTTTTPWLWRRPG